MLSAALNDRQAVFLLFCCLMCCNTCLICTEPYVLCHMPGWLGIDVSFVPDGLGSKSLPGSLKGSAFVIFASGSVYVTASGRLNAALRSLSCNSQVSPLCYS